MGKENAGMSGLVLDTPGLVSGSSTRQASARAARLLLTALIVGVAYYAGVWIGFTTAFPGPDSARRHLFWPPNVILLAALLITPVRWWWSCSLTAFAAHLLAHAQLGLAPAVMALPVQFAGNLLQAVLAAFTLRRLSNPPWRVDTLRSMIAVIVVAGVAAPALVSALVIYVYVWAGWMQDYASAWSVRFLANAVSTITLAPLLFPIAGQGMRGLRHVPPRRATEFVTVLAGLLLVGTLISRSATSATQLPLLYAPLPLLLWAAVRFGSSGLSIALLATLLLFVSQILGGPSITPVPADNTITLVVFLVGIAIPLLLFAALMEEQQAKEEALKESEERFRNMADYAPVMVWVSDPNASGSFLSKSWYEFTGQTPETGLGFGWVNAVHPDDRAYAHDTFVTANEKREPFRFEYRLRRHDDEYRWVIDSAAPRFGPQGNFLGYTGSVLDITERKRAEDKSNELLHRLDERVKELTALHRAARILQNEKLATAEWLQQFVGVLPPAWQYPEITAARIQLGELELATANFKPTPWMQRADFSVAEGLRGTIEVAYLEERPTEQEGPFLTEERNVIDSLAEMLRAAIERRQTQERLSLLQTITMEVGAANDFSAALEVVVRRVCEKTGWVIGQAWIPRQDGTVLDCSPAWFSVATGLGEFRKSSEATTFLPDVGLPGRVWSSKHPLWVQDVTFDPNFPRVQVASEVGLKAALAIPILSGDEVLAVIEFFMREPRGEDERLVKVITAVAAQFGFFIERKRAEQTLRENETALRASYDRIQDLAGRLITAQEAERSRIAGELHDDVNQQLAGLSIALSNVKRQLQNRGAATVQDELSRLQQRTVDLADVIRNLSHEMHPGVLQHAGLAAALKSHCAEFGSQHPIEVTFSAVDGIDAIPHDVALCLYRVAQESLRNIAAHAAAHNARINLRSSEAGLELVIADDGEGFDLAEAQRLGGLGLISLEERVRLVGGSLAISTEPQHGTEVRVQVPLGGNP
jgi:PAS domain S-box-containing protein